MAAETLRAGPTPATPKLHDELRSLVLRSSNMEDALRRAAATLDAINIGGLLEAAPKGEEEYRRFCAATSLLDMLRAELRRLEEVEETEVSISLSCLASDADAGRITRLRYYPE